MIYLLCERTTEFQLQSRQWRKGRVYKAEDDLRYALETSPAIQLYLKEITPVEALVLSRGKIRRLP